MSERQQTPYLGAKGLRVIAMLACVFNVVTIAGIHYQEYMSGEISRGNISSLINFPALVSETIFLCPMLVVLIARRNAPIVISYASILFVILLGRIYYLLPFQLTGVRGWIQKYDWSDICLILLGTLSGAAIAVWAIVRFSHVTLLKRIDILRRAIR